MIYKIYSSGQCTKVSLLDMLYVLLG